MTLGSGRLLVVSLVLNALLLGVVIGGGWRLTHRRGPAAATGLRVAGDGLSAAQRPRFRTLLRDTRVAGRPLARQARQARTAAAAALVETPLDRAALAAALDRARAADFALRRSREEAIMGFAATLAPADRAALATGLRTTMLRRPARRAPAGTMGEGS